MNVWHLAPTIALALFVGAVTCTPAEQHAADRTAQDVCALIAPASEGGLELLDKFMHDVAELARLELARLDAGAAADVADARARDAKGDR